MGTWPAVQPKIATVPNELRRNWDEESTPAIDVAQTLPPEIAGISVPALDDASADAIAAALEATARLQACSDRAPGVTLATYGTINSLSSERGVAAVTTGCL